MSDFTDKIAAGYQNAPCTQAEALSIDGPHIIRTNTFLELRVLTSQILTDYFDNDPEIATEIEETLRHEASHAYAVKQLGAKEIIFGVVLMRNGHNSFTAFTQVDTDTFNGDILCAVAATLHPKNPSPGDKKSAMKHGYDVHRAGMVITQHNREYGTRIPLPLSYRSSSSTILDLAAVSPTGQHF